MWHLCLEKASEWMEQGECRLEEHADVCVLSLSPHMSFWSKPHLLLTATYGEGGRQECGVQCVSGCAVAGWAVAGVSRPSLRCCCFFPSQLFLPMMKRSCWSSGVAAWKRRNSSASCRILSVVLTKLEPNGRDYQATGDYSKYKVKCCLWISWIFQISFRSHFPFMGFLLEQMGEIHCMLSSAFLQSSCWSFGPITSVNWTFSTLATPSDLLKLLKSKWGFPWQIDEAGGGRMFIRLLPRKCQPSWWPQRWSQDSPNPSRCTAPCPSLRLPAGRRFSLCLQLPWRPTSPHGASTRPPREARLQRRKLMEAHRSDYEWVPVI